MKAYWDLVKEKLKPTYAKVTAAQTELNKIRSYMIHADATPARAQLDALHESAPDIDGSPAIRDDSHNDLLLSLKAKLAWIHTNKNVHWNKAINTALKEKKDNLTAGDEWQIYGEALLADQRGEEKETRWNVPAGRTAKAIEDAADEAKNAALNTWLKGILARTKTLNNLWTAATAPVNGTYGNIPRATVEQLFIRYEPNMTRRILTNAVAANISGDDWGGVKYLAGNRRYARELKINAMGGDHRVFSKKATPKVLDTIGPGLH
jgi:hypothetical protein